MTHSSTLSVVEFFDTIAPQWDSWHDLQKVGSDLDKGLLHFGVRHDEHVLDVGCGTGNLTAALLHRLKENGRVTAIDISEAMINNARSKIKDPRVTWIHGSVETPGTVPDSFDRIICFSVWPHLTNTEETGKLLYSILKPGGKLHIWHLISRDEDNRIHSQSSPAVKSHLLAPAREMASLLETIGFAIEETTDNEKEYLITASRVG